MSTQSPDRNPIITNDVTLPAVNNPPGRDALAYRMRTHDTFSRAMTAALSTRPELQGLAHGDVTDPALALVDAWATTLDVLTFYQERIANEGYLRTASERRSLQELGRAVGYELNPGVAAQTYLAFTLEEGAGAPEKVLINAGTKVQSVPGPGEQAQVFETVETIEARPEWNVLKSKLSAPRKPQKGDFGIYLEGINTNLRIGDGLLIVGCERAGGSSKHPDRNQANENWDFRRIKTINPDSINNRTLVTWDDGLGSVDPPVDPAQDNPQVYAFRLRAALFGHNAPDWTAMPASIQENYNKAATTKKVKSPGAQWPGFTIHEISRQAVDQLDTVQLDAVYAQIRPGIESWVVLVCPNHTELYNVDDTVEDAVTDFTMSSKTTRLKLCGENLNEFDNKLRKTIVFAQSEKLEIADAPVLPDGAILVQDAKPCPVQGVQIDLAHPIPLLPAGRTLFITGTNEKTDAVRHEWAVLEKMDPNGATLFLRDSLQRDESQPTGYRRSSVTIYANVARATHGETREEVLGSGDAAQPFQQFALREAPLTYTPATTPSGGCSTLQMRVNEILWDETDTLDGKPAQAHLFTTQEGPDGKPLVHFGDGVTGARLPSGVENISAAYRVGLGAAGNLQAHQLRVLLSGLLGVNAVHNPQPAVGGVDPEAVSAARSNAPYTALTLGRLVSLRDYEDFARAFGGVGKARATWQWNGTRGVVIVTVVAPDGKELNEETAKLLQQAIQAVRDPAQQVKVIKQAASSFTIAARLVIKPAYRADRVKAAADSTLRQAFSLPQRDFGQCVSESDILGVLQTVDGVQAADLTAFSVEVASPDTLLILKEGPDAIRLEAVTDLNTPEMKGGQP